MTKPKREHRVDQRTFPARQLKSLIDRADHPGTQVEQLKKQAGAIAHECNKLIAAQQKGEAVDATLLATLSNTLSNAQIRELSAATKKPTFRTVEEIKAEYAAKHEAEEREAKRQQRKDEGYFPYPRPVVQQPMKEPEMREGWSEDGAGSDDEVNPFTRLMR